MFEQMAPIEVRQAMLVGGKMGRHPVQDNTDTVLMQGVDEKHQILRRAVVGAGREKTGNLITPRTEKRMVHERQKFNVSEASLAHISRQPRRHFAIGKRTIAFFGEHASKSLDAVHRWTSELITHCALCARTSKPGLPRSIANPKQSTPTSAQSR